MVKFGGFCAIRYCFSRAIVLVCDTAHASHTGMPALMSTSWKTSQEKPGQEKGCCLQSFALRCGQFQVPSHQFFIYFLWWGWGPETGLTARLNPVGQEEEDNPEKEDGDD